MVRTFQGCLMPSSSRRIEVCGWCRASSFCGTYQKSSVPLSATTFAEVEAVFSVAESADATEIPALCKDMILSSSLAHAYHAQMT